MRDKILWFLIGALAVSAAIWVKRSLYLISTSDPDYNTIYSAGYNEKNFNLNLLGLNETELNQLLGKPLAKYQNSFSHILLYTENKDSIYLNRDCNCVRRKGELINKKYRCFYIDSTGKVERVKIVGFAEDKKDYVGITKEKILTTFGKPDDEILDNLDCEVLSYSALTEGAQSGKTSARHVRQVLLNRHKIAVQIIKKVVDMYHVSFYEE